MRIGILRVNKAGAARRVYQLNNQGYSGHIPVKAGNLSIHYRRALPCKHAEYALARSNLPPLTSKRLAPLG